MSQVVRVGVAVIVMHDNKILLGERIGAHGADTEVYKSGKQKGLLLLIFVNSILPTIFLALRTSTILPYMYRQSMKVASL